MHIVTAISLFARVAHSIRMLPLCIIASKLFRASSRNSLRNVSLTCSPGSTMPPGRAHCPQSFL
ncbi:hypothetical protein NQ318_022379 [Aromia moschata]|uniref:Uncharacterized protein n=1 Tax=Aromia moschata TaxID=1265417 RepID=A0AAV8Z792_9CUCU|nr:hypothetical protein NQ318_022379 [Aromia moschata]